MRTQKREDDAEQHDHRSLQANGAVAFDEGLAHILTWFTGEGGKRNGCNAEVFDGNSVKNQDNFFLRFTRMSKTDAHIITAEAGDVISVELEIEKGRVDIVIGAEGDEPIYFGNDVDSGKFELPVSAAGQYKVTVEARGAAGEIAVQRLPNAAEE